MKYAFVLFALSGLAGCSTTPATAPATGGPSTGQSAGAPMASASPTADSGMFTGKVVETMNSGGYTYVRLQSGQKDVWIAATEFPAKQGENLTVSLEMPMDNFHSATLNRDFPVIYFVAAVARDGETLQPAPGAMAGAPGAPAPAGPITVQPNAPPGGGMSIADAWAKRKQLSGKEVTVRGTVVKVNNGIMGRNWFHLQDGSGKADAGTNDLTVTTDAVVKVGDVVTVTGTLGIDKDFTAGYAYDVILEKATIK